MAWADRTPVEQAEIDYCAPRGIPLTRFRGKPVYPGEPEWEDEDRAAVYDWLAKEAGRCSGCGVDLDESMAKENSFAYKAEPLECHGCRAIHRAALKLAGHSGKEDPLAGIRYRVTKREA